MLGTCLGVLAGMLAVLLIGSDPTLLFSLLLVDIWLTYYFFTDRYAAMSFFLTVLLASLFALTGRFSRQLLWLRIEETALGAAASLLVASLLFPRATHENVRQRLLELLDAMSELVDAALGALAEGGGQSLSAPGRKLESAEAALRAALRPLQLDRLGSGGRIHEIVLEDLRACDYWLHELSLAARMAGPPTQGAAWAAIDQQRQRFAASLRGLREIARTDRVPSKPGQVESDHAALARPPRAPSERIDVAARALRHAAAALADVGEAIGPGLARTRF